jgi:hypothetical protein
MINAGVAWNSGTSFPGSKATGDRYWRTDLALEFYWDGTRWVTTTLYSLPFGYPAAPLSPASASTTVRMGDPHPTLDAWLVDFWAWTYVVTTNDASKYWTLVMSNQTGPPTLSTISNAADAGIQESTSLNQVLTAGSGIYLAITKVSTPGNIHATPMFSYRLIAT